MNKKDVFDIFDKLLPSEITSVSVGVSGGADSLCLMLLLSEWCKKKNVKLTALTVDHGLRKESKDEAKWVGKLCQKNGIFHKILTWKGQKPNTKIEEMARQKRYELISGYCQKNKISHLFLAHHQNDQTETFFLRLARSSSVDGLASMSEKSSRQGLVLLRPFLNFSKDDIQSFLSKNYISDWVEDPSNECLDFERVRFRQFQSRLDEFGLTTKAVALTAKRLGRVRSCLENLTQDFVLKKVQLNDAGFAFVSKDDFDVLPEELKIRVLIYLLLHITPSEDKLVRLNRVEEVMNVLYQRTRSLMGCLIVPRQNGFFVCAEQVRMEQGKKILKNKKTCWDRFEILSSEDVFVSPLGDFLKPKRLPALVRRTIPAFFDKKGLVSVPHLDYKRKNTDIKINIHMKVR